MNKAHKISILLIIIVVILTCVFATLNRNSTALKLYSEYNEKLSSYVNKNEKALLILKKLNKEKISIRFEDHNPFFNNIKDQECMINTFIDETFSDMYCIIDQSFNPSSAKEDIVFKDVEFDKMGIRVVSSILLEYNNNQWDVYIVDLEKNKKEFGYYLSKLDETFQVLNIKLKRDESWKIKNK